MGRFSLLGIKGINGTVLFIGNKGINGTVLFIVTTRPYGDTTFIEKLEQNFGYRLRALPRVIKMKNKEQPSPLVQPMSERQANNPLHGITLEQIVNSLVELYGWNEMGKRINIRCFNSDPSVKSSLKFLRKTPWARKKVEDLYILTQKKIVK
jgi:hypothetical protein